MIDRQFSIKEIEVVSGEDGVKISQNQNTIVLDLEKLLSLHFVLREIIESERNNKK